MERWLVQNKKQAEFFNQFVLEEAEAGRERLYTLVRANRSNKQNNALHLLFRRMANDLNDAGIDYPHPLNESFRMQWNELRVKELLFVPYCEWMFKTKHSHELDTKQLSEVMEALVDGVNQSTGVYTPIPSQELTDGSY